MFRQFAMTLGAGSTGLFRLHPLELAALLEQAWNHQVHDPGSDTLGHPDRRSDLPGLPGSLAQGLPGFFANRTAVSRRVRWDHLIYAYLIETTGVYEVFRKVIHEFRHGEKLGVPLPGSEHWLRSTEELFYREPPPFTIYSITSWVRPELEASRRNAYYRMFGMKLNDKVVRAQEFQAPPAQEANTGFVPTFEEFLREVWLAITNFTNVSGANPTDDSKIRNLAERLHDMLRARRLDSEISRQELFYVSMMSWLHLTLESNSPIILSLRSEAPSPEERLFKVAERVGMPCHSLAKHFFDMADQVSLLLIQIELGVFNDTANVPILYDPAGGLVPGLREIITNWSITTGRDLRARKVAAS